MGRLTPVPTSVRTSIDSSLQPLDDAFYNGLAEYRDSLAALQNSVDSAFTHNPAALHLDEEGWQEVVAILEEATKLMLAAHVRSQDRLSEGDSEDTVSTVVGMAAFETAGSLEAA